MPNFQLKDSFLVMVKIINTHPSSYSSTSKHKTKIEDLTTASSSFGFPGPKLADSTFKIQEFDKADRCQAKHLTVQ